ncbi:calcium-binding protein [Inquilinus sp. CA228]|uniref:calcium-binding protein n=1 Tax=Inquilinus sp. CA228 TaxID=3455609 RepID=UPI003F8D6858
MAVVSGTAGSDVIHVAGDGAVIPSGFIDIDDATNSFPGFSGNDLILAGAGNDIVIAGSGSDLLSGDAGDDILIGAAGDDSLLGGDGNDTLKGGAGGDAFVGGAGIDTVDYSDSASGIGAAIGRTATFNAGDEAGDTLNSDIENVIGTGFQDILEGSAADNVLTGLAGFDQILGDAGNDTLLGGNGDDVLVGGAGADRIDGGDGIDHAIFNGPGNMTINLTTQTVSGGEGQGDILTSIESAFGGSGDDTIIGSTGFNRLVGAEGNDVINGLDGNDQLFGERGNDLLRGGAGADQINDFDGIDTATYSDSAGGVTVDLAAGTGSGADAQGDTLTGIENLNGSAFGDSLLGDINANMMRGLGGVDQIAGGGGDDTLAGGAGADSLFGGTGLDTALYDDGSVGVTVNLFTSTGSGGTAQGDTYLDIENVIGSAFGDSLTGDNGANRLRGGAGNDILRGGLGGDVLDGGSGIDLATYFGAAVGVKVNLQAGASSDDDTLFSIENVNGGQGGEVLTGNAGTNVLNGFEGNDVLAGGGGKDVLGGGVGADVFAFTAIGDSVVGANADRITDFSRAQGDKIDLSAIDANTAAAGNQAFTFIGSALFHKVAGELRFAVTSPGVTTIAGDVNGDGASDFHIVLAGTVALQAGDFVL